LRHSAKVERQEKLVAAIAKKVIEKVTEYLKPGSPKLTPEEPVKKEPPLVYVAGTLEQSYPGGVVIKITDVFNSQKSTGENYTDAEVFALKNSAKIVLPTPFKPQEVQEGLQRLVDFNELPTGPGAGIIERRFRDFAERVRKTEHEQKPKPEADQMLRNASLSPNHRPQQGPSLSP
jgi:hypothetical protein